MSKEVFNLPNREAATQMQIAPLLGLFGNLGNFLIACRHIEGEETRGGAMDGGAKAAAEAAFIKVCDRIEAIVEDKERWSLGTQLTMEKALEEAYKANGAMLTEQGQLYREMRSPHYNFKPALVKLGPANWLAILGNMQDLDRSICGMGSCPQEALEAFDEIFRGMEPAKLKAFMESIENQQKEPNEPQQPEKTVDASGSPETPRTERTTPERRDNRRRPWSFRGIRKPQTPKSGNQDGTDTANAS